MTIKKEILNNIGLGVILIFVMVGVSQLIGLSMKGFDTKEILEQYFFYVSSGIAFVIGIVFILIIELVITKGDNKYGNSLLFNSPGDFPALLNINRIKNPFALSILSMIIFGILGLWATITKQNTFTGIATLKQQFTTGSSLLFSSALMPASENLGLAFVSIALIIFVFRWLARKYDWDRNSFRILVILSIILISGIYGLANHLFRYSTSDIDLITVFVFWMIGGILTIITGSFIPFWFMHISNNLFFDLRHYYSNDIIVIVTIILIVILSFIYFTFFIKKKGEVKVEK